jgi:hypothetical protein
MTTLEKARTIIAGSTLQGMKVVFVPVSKRQNELGLKQAKTVLDHKEYLTPEDRWLIWALDVYEQNEKTN